MSYSKEQEGSTPQEPEKSALKALPILLLLEGIISQAQFPVPGEADFFRLADELEKDPPLDLDLTPDDLSLVIQILRGN